MAEVSQVNQESTKTAESPGMKFTDARAARLAGGAPASPAEAFYGSNLATPIGSVEEQIAAGIQQAAGNGNAGSK